MNTVYQKRKEILLNFTHTVFIINQKDFRPYNQLFQIIIQEMSLKQILVFQILDWFPIMISNLYSLLTEVALLGQLFS